MTTKNQLIEVYQGEDKTITVNLTNSANAAYGSTTGLTFTWEVAADASAASVLITKSTGSGITNGTSAITITLADTDTDALAPGQYYHECRVVVDATTLEDVVFCGGFIIKDSLTN